MAHRLYLKIIVCLLVMALFPASVAAKEGNSALGGMLPLAGGSRALVAPPVLVSPANLAVLHHKRPAFDWRDVPNATNYQMQASRLSTFRILLIDATTASSTYVSTSDLPGRVIVFWRVRAQVGGTYTPWSKIWRFVTGNPPSIPTLLSPADRAEVSGLSPRFDWGNSIVPLGARFGYYQIQVAADSGFNTIVHTKNLSGVANSHDDNATLAADTTYFWRVRSFSANGDYSAWSPIWSLTVAVVSSELFDPQELEYLGAFRLPEGGNRPFSTVHE